MEIGQLVVTSRGLEKVVQITSDTMYSTEVIVEKELIAEMFDRFVINKDPKDLFIELLVDEIKALKEQDAKVGGMVKQVNDALVSDPWLSERDKLAEIKRLVADNKGKKKTLPISQLAEILGV